MSTANHEHGEDEEHHHPARSGGVSCALDAQRRNAAGSEDEDFIENHIGDIREEDGDDDRFEDSTPLEVLTHQCKSEQCGNAEDLRLDIIRGLARQIRILSEPLQGGVSEDPAQVKDRTEDQAQEDAPLQGPAQSGRVFCSMGLGEERVRSLNQAKEQNHGAEGPEVAQRSLCQRDSTESADHPHIDQSHHHLSHLGQNDGKGKLNQGSGDGIR